MKYTCSICSNKLEPDRINKRRCAACQVKHSQNAKLRRINRKKSEICFKCGNGKPTRPSLGGYCKKCNIENRLKVLKISPIYYDDVFKSLLNSSIQCEICGINTSGDDKDWNIDHCHITGKFRGILCSHCNLMLGCSKDNPETLKRAADYLERSGQADVLRMDVPSM